MSYTLQTTVTGEFDEVLETTTAALEDEGIGILSDIDVGTTLTENLDVEFRNYRILGACNPSLAHEVLTDQISGGTLLPCGVAIYEDDGGVTVRSGFGRAALPASSAFPDIVPDTPARRINVPLGPTGATTRR